MGRLDRLYRRMTPWGQHVAVSLYGVYWYWLRFGPGWDRCRRQYLIREGFSSEEWRQWSKEALCKVLRAAADHVPYYSSSWSKSEKAAARAGRVEDLPLLDKDAIRSNPQAFLRQGLRRRPPKGGMGSRRPPRPDPAQGADGAVMPAGAQGYK